MHICCANCALFPVRSLRTGGGHEVTGFWFNPNIHPAEEYGRRLVAVRDLSARWDMPVIYEGDHDREGFDARVRADAEGADPLAPGARCAVCYCMRMTRTAEKALELGMDAFTASLLVSPYQRHDLVAEAGRRAGQATGVPFHYEDFRAGYREGARMSREMGFYRQYYCGCAYSKAERDAERTAKTTAVAR